MRWQDGSCAREAYIERFRAKWEPVRVKKTRQNKNLEPRFDSIETEKALAFSSEVDSGSREENASKQSADGCVMKVEGKHIRSIWLEPDGWSVGAIDQRHLPHDFVVARLTSCDAAADAIRSMLVRGAPLIGATAAYGMALAMRAHGSDVALDQAYGKLIATRPTAINLKWALDEMRSLLRPLPPAARVAAAYSRAGAIAEQDIAINQGIGRHGLALIEAVAAA